MCRFKLLITFVILSQALLVNAVEPEDLVSKDSFELCHPINTVQWDGGGDGTSWADPMNWKGDTLPIDGDSVSIRAGSADTIIYDNSRDTTRITCLDSSESLMVTGGVLELDGNGWVRQNVTVTGGTLTVSGSFRISGDLEPSGGFLSGVGTVTVAGLFTWSNGQQTETGETIANAGMSLTSPGTSRFMNSRTLTLNDASTWSGGLLRLQNSATINNNGPFDIKTDDDMQYRSGSNSTFNNNAALMKTAGSGLTDIQAILTNFDSISTSTGSLGFGRTFEQDITGTLNVGISSSSVFDRYAVSQSTTLDGTLEITLEGGFKPGLGETFEIMTFASRVGTFAAVNGLAIVSGKKFAISYEATRVVLELVTDP